MKKQNKRYYFRVQYQKGKYEISEKIEGSGYLPIVKMIEVILDFVMKVKNEVGDQLGGKIALEALKYIFKLCYNVEMDWHGTGSSKSTYISTVDKSERFDVEFLGIGGRDDLSNEHITRFIKAYKLIVKDKITE